MKLSVFVLAVAVLLLVAALLFWKPREVARETVVRTVRDTVLIVRTVPRTVIRYRTVPRVEVGALPAADSSGTQPVVPFVRMSHDTVIGHDTVRVVAEYPPPRLAVWLSRGPLQDTLRLERSWMENVQTVQQVTAQPSVLQHPLFWFTAGVAVGALTVSIVK